jgi:hypothetical protein
MSEVNKPRIYRELIDALVQMCKGGQGQIGARRAISGVWNPNATQDFIPDQHRINLFLAGLSASDREILASMLIHEVEVGIFETLKTLESFEIEPFKDGYEGSPFNDFIGRLADWNWPETEQDSMRE